MARTTPNVKDTVKSGNKKKKPLGKKDSDDSGISDAEKRADAKQAERDRRTGRRYLEQARNLNPQAIALTKAIGEMKDRRKQDMRDIIKTRALQMDMLVDTAADMGEQYDIAAKNNEVAAGGTLEAGISNMVRERAETLSQLLTQGAGESDTMRAMLMAARNQNANAREANQSYWDTIASINQSIVTMNEDTQAKLADAWISGEGEREQISRDYLESSSDAYTQLGLVRQAQADAYANAREYKVKPPRLGKNKKKGKARLSKSQDLSTTAGLAAAKDEKVEDVSGEGKNFSKKLKGVPADKMRRRQSRKAFNTWAELQDESYKQKRVPGWVKDYQGKAQFDGRQSNSNLAAALTVETGPKAEGAKLRKWG